jgi:peptidyl-prolyl cis-trans isomerase D
MQQISDKAQAALQKDPSHPEIVAAQLGMQVVHADGFAPGSAVPGVGPSADFDQSIATLKKGEVSQPVAPSSDKVMLAELVDVIPARPSTFDEVKTQIRDSLVSSKLGALVQDHAKQLVEAAKANGGDLAKAAKAIGLEAKTTALFKRAGNVDDLGSATYFEAAFDQPVGTVLNPIPMPDNTVVVKVTQHADADMSKLPEQRAQILDAVKTERAKERNTVFETGVVDELTRRGIVKTHDDVVKRIIDSYRGNS